MKQPIITLGEPVVIAQADPSVTDWGPWQFPTVLSRMADGGIHLSYHAGNDSAASYGRENPHAVSYDNGASWRHVDAIPSPDGLLLPNGDRLRIKVLRPVKAEGLPLPKPVAEEYRLTVERRFYPAGDIPHEYCGYPFERLAMGSGEWVVEKHYPAIPDELRCVVNDVLANYPAGDPTAYLPMPAIWDTLKIAPNGKLWATTYTQLDLHDGNIVCHAIILISDDNGKTFKYHSRILYEPDPGGDPLAARREGFTEPDIAFMPDGSIICILRTQDSNGNGPSYIARSTDGGLTWSKPCIFDEFGVWPQLLQLGNGATLLSYGRPGFFVRATADPFGLEWGIRVQILEPGHGTCSYSGLLAIDDQSALVTYSDFSFPNAEGIPVKTILGRRVTVRLGE
ncbi:MAG: sialidase family protein [Anaerolineae bacterium]